MMTNAAGMMETLAIFADSLAHLGEQNSARPIRFVAYPSFGDPDLTCIPMG
jgi:hypothetical protein